MAYGAASAPAFAQARGAAVIPAPVTQSLNRMGTALRALSSFELKADVTTEEVLMSGQKLQNSALMTFNVTRPNRLFIDVASEQRRRQFFYDGKTFTVYSPALGYFAAVDAPPTIKALMQDASDRYGIELPMTDLFSWGTEAFPIDRIRSAVYAGTDRINGQVCEHLAFRQKSVDWQVWINQGQPALPCKLVIVNTEDPAQPTTTAVYSWTTKPTFTDARFRFAAPPWHLPNRRRLSSCHREAS